MLKIYTYRIPFASPFRVAGNEYSHRKGIILVYQDQDLGIEAYGEIAPLPGFSQENLDEVKEVLLLNREHLQKTIPSEEAGDTLQVLDQIHQFPSLSFGLDTLLHDLAAKRSEKSLVQYLFPEFDSAISTNGTLPIKEKSTTLSEADRLYEKGFRTLKIKVGENFNKEHSILRSLRQKYPDLKIRIDANQAWSVDETISNLKVLENLDIEYCEQPVSKDHSGALREVTDASKIPIAADESVRNKKAVTELSQEHAVDLMIFKPMLMGTFNDIFVTKELVDTHNIEIVFTTSLETAVGRAAITAISAGLINKDRAQGLATGSFLKSDFTSENWMDQPVITFPDKIGLGISLHYEGLKDL
jgi:o-succinylbenzoate synthase